MTEPTPGPGSSPAERPVTGEPGVDAALAGLDGLDDRPVGEHYDRLSRAHEALHEVLQSPTAAGDSAVNSRSRQQRSRQQRSRGADAARRTPLTPSDPPLADQPSQRLDRALVERGLARSRGQAVGWIRDGQVLVDGRPGGKASELISAGQELQITAPDHYVSRAAHKLLGALTDLGSAVRPLSGLRVLDAGASTGGFSQVLVERGVGEVVAVDVGHDQLAPRLRNEPRIRSLEGVNLRDLDLDLLEDRRVDLVVADVSFISLRLLVEPLIRVLDPAGQLLVMVKPQFEVGRGALGKGGVVRDPELHRRAVNDVVAAAGRLGWRPVAAAPSRLPGPAGNREFFVLLTHEPAEPADAVALLGL